MITYRCPPERANTLAARLERIVQVAGFPIHVGRHHDGGVFIKWTTKDPVARSSSHWALMDAERVCGVRELTNNYEQGCRLCTASRTNYDHTDAICAAFISLRREFGIARVAP